MRGLIPTATKELSEAGAPRQLSVLENLQEKKMRLEADLVRVNDAIEALNSHPDIEKVIRLVGLAF